MSKRKTFISDISNALKEKKGLSTQPFYGVVKDKVLNSQGRVVAYKVSLGDEDDVIEARKFAGANVNDIVLLTPLNNGMLVVTGTRDGDTDIKDVAENLETNYDTSEEVDRKIGEIEIGESTIQYGISANTSTQPTEWSSDFVPPTSSKPICWIRRVNAEGEVIESPKQATVTNNPYIFMSKIGAKDSQGNITLIDGGFIKTGTLIVTGDVISGGTIRGVRFVTQGDNGIVILDDGGISMGTSESDIQGALTHDGLYFGSSMSQRTMVDASGVDAPSLTSRGNLLVYSGIRYDGALYKMSIPGANSDSYEACWHANTSGDGSYMLCRPSSGRKYKEDIKPVEDFNPDGLYDIPIVQFKFKDDPNHKDVIGMIAEDVYEYFPVGATIVDGEPDGWDTRKILPAVIKLIQDQHKDIKELKNRVDELEAKLRLLLN